MAERDLERLLGEAFDARARELVPDSRPVPPIAVTPSVAPHRRRWLAPLASAAAVVLAVGVGIALGRSGGSGHGPAGTAASPAALPTADPGAAPVRLRFQPADGAAIGVGLPVIAQLSAPITDGRALQGATRVRVNGRTTAAAWYVLRASADGSATAPAGEVAVLRPARYWPAHSTVSISVAVKGLSAGHGLGFVADYNLDFSTGAAVVATVSDRTHQITVTSDGRRVASYPVSLGTTDRPTSRGVKVVLAKHPSTCLHDVAKTYYECNIKDAQQLTRSGEYLLAAPWDAPVIGKRDASSGSTDLLPVDALRLYRLLQVGDVVTYPDATGPLLAAADGGWWNVPWSTWQQGGAVRTH